MSISNVKNLQTLSNNELIQEFYLGNDEAWEILLGKVRYRLIFSLKIKFPNFNSLKIDECVESFLVDFWIRVFEERKLPGNSAVSVKGGFDPVKGDFFNWARFCISNNIIDLLRKGDGEILFEDMNNSENYAVNETSSEDFEFEEDFSESDFEDPFDRLHKEISVSLDSNQLIYFNFWWNLYWNESETMKNENQFLDKKDDSFYEKVWRDPSADDIRTEILNKTGENLTDTEISNLKSLFRINTYLTLIESDYPCHNFKDFFRKMSKAANLQSLMFNRMLEKTWKSFFCDQDTKKELITACNSFNWREMFKDAEKGYNLQPARIRILQITNDYFKSVNKKPEFIKLIEIYSKDLLGRKIKDLFEGENNEQ